MLSYIVPTSPIGDMIYTSGTHVFQVKSSHGYKVTAPLGLTFCCADTGVFRPASAASGNRYKVGLSFPGLRLMVFDVPNTKFGPEWYCGELMSIGLLVGVIITVRSHKFTISLTFYGTTHFFREVLRHLCDLVELE